MDAAFFVLAETPQVLSNILMGINTDFAKDLWKRIDNIKLLTFH